MMTGKQERSLIDSQQLKMAQTSFVRRVDSGQGKRDNGEFSKALLLLSSRTMEVAFCNCLEVVVDIGLRSSFFAHHFQYARFNVSLPIGRHAHCFVIVGGLCR
mmetsp:Transcript_19120/g.52464  ORF Transcript_19120/g.52464 Transcript_19120/m.52464 type:complete len:103 (-) Transcript_19120:1842-2150(-)